MNLVTEGVVFALIRVFFLLLFWRYFIHYGAVGLGYTYLMTYALQTLYLCPYVWHRSKRLSALDWKPVKISCDASI